MCAPLIKFSDGLPQKKISYYLFLRNFYKHLISDASMKSLDLNAQAESKLLYSSMFLSLQNGLKLQDSRKFSWSFAYCLKSHHGVREFHLLRLHHKDSLRKRVVLERYPQPQISRILQVADFRESKTKSKGIKI